MSKVTRAWILILIAGLVAGVLEIIEYGGSIRVTLSGLPFGSCLHCRSQYGFVVSLGSN